MTCEEANRLLLDDLAGRLDDRGRTDLQKHLDECTACRETAAVQVEVAQALASRPETEARPEFAARLRQRIDRESGWLGIADWRWLSVRLAPVAGVLLLTAGVVIGQQASKAAVPSLSTVVETWASGGDDEVPVTSVLWQEQASEDAAVLTVLAAPSDATIARQSNER